MENYQTYYDAAEAALANYTGEDDIDPSTIELVTDLLIQAVKVLPNWGYYQSLLEKSSSYVQTDLDELELNDYVGELETQLEDFGLV